eukprot:6459272-Amphidinium_carterae.3
MAAGQYLYSKYQRWVLEKAVIEKVVPVRLLCYIECMLYDETPMKLKVADPIMRLPSVSQFDDTSLDPSESNSKRQMQLLVSIDASATKVFQVRQTFGFLLAMDDGCWKIFGETPCPISILGRNSALVIQEALSRLSGSTILSNNFKVSSRVACMDSHAANLKAEASLSASQKRKWSTLISRCEIHHCSRAFKKTYDGLMEGDISAIIHLSLALRTGTAMSVFRTCLKDVIHEQLCILYTPVPEECKVYKQKFMCLCLSSGANLLMKRMVLCKLPNGDWTKSGVVEVHVGHDSRGRLSKPNLAQVLCGSLTYILCGCKPAVWPRHRWTGCDLSVEQLLRLEGIHNLLSSTWRKFLLAYGKGVVNCAVGNSHACDVGEDANEEIHADDDVLQEGAGLDNGAGELQIGTNQTQKNAADNARDRRIATAWINSSSQMPLATLVLLRTSMDPLIKLLNSQLDISSLDWELRQQASLAAWFNTPDADPAKMPLRHFQVTIAAEGLLEKEYMQSITALFGEVWELIPAQATHVEFRRRCFQVLSRQAALVYATIELQHTMFPTKLFRLLRNKSLADEIAADARANPCMLDKWSEQVLNDYPTLKESELHHVLEGHAQLVVSSIASVEARHASLRRFLLSRLQSHSLDATELSADFFLQQLRRSKSNARSTSATTQVSGKRVSKRKVAQQQHSMFLRLAPTPKEEQHRRHVLV